MTQNLDTISDCYYEAVLLHGLLRGLELLFSEAAPERTPSPASSASVVLAGDVKDRASALVDALGRLDDAG